MFLFTAYPCTAGLMMLIYTLYGTFHKIVLILCCVQLDDLQQTNVCSNYNRRC